MFSLAGVIIYIGLLIIFLLGVSLYSCKKTWVKVVSFLLMLPFILSTIWMFIWEFFN